MATNHGQSKPLATASVTADIPAPNSKPPLCSEINHHLKVLQYAYALSYLSVDLGGYLSIASRIRNHL